MQYITIDAETYWSQNHSLSEMNPILYCTHPETELISVSCKINGESTYTIWGEKAIQAWAKLIPWEDLAVIAHNGNGFDFMLLVWRLGAHPRLFIDTMAMARPIHAKTTGVSLKTLVRHYGLGVKDATALHQTKGKHLLDFTNQELADMGTYNRMDVDQTWGLFQKLLPLTPLSEMKLIDMTARMLVYPQFHVDQQLLTRGLKAERARKRIMLMELAQHLGIIGLTDEDIAAQARTILMSAAKFSEILVSRGVPVPTKISPTTGKETPALAKTDEAFTALQEHPDPIVSTATRARLGVKSTILESRIEAMLALSTALDGKMPIPLQYYGADTTGRFSGCLVADTKVLCYDTQMLTVKEVCIVDVLPDDLVWDGEAFVAHDGVAFSGYAEVVEWDGIVGTADHVVFTEREEISLLEASERQLPIKTCRRPTEDEVDAARRHARYNKARTAM
jgi:DNA polymerase